MIPAAFHIAMACGVAYMILWRFGNTGAPHSVFIPMRRMPLTIAACIWLARHQNEEPSGLTGCFKLLALLAAE